VLAVDTMVPAEVRGGPADEVALENGRRAGRHGPHRPQPEARRRAGLGAA
jgi:hypothetical protein